MVTASKALLGAMLACALPALAQTAPAKNVIFFLGDGFGPAAITAARIYKVKEEGLLNFEKLPRVARLKTYSLDAQTTDSAPSMGAYMTGHKINNDGISMDAKAIGPAKDANGNNTIVRCDPSGKPLVTLAELSKAAGKSIGAVTTTELTHATPAATLTHTCHRDNYYAIAQQLVPGGEGYNTALGDGVDVLMGGGRQYFMPYDKATNPKGRADGRNMPVEFALRGYAVGMHRADMLAAVPGKKYVGMYAQGHLDYALARPDSQPQLKEMAVKAIELLSPNPKGFFLMVEGGKIDHGLHESNAINAMGDAVAFDDAIQAVIDKMNQLDPGLKHTLIVITADHDHTLQINGYPKRGNPITDIVRSYKDGLPARDADGKTYTTLVYGNGPNRPAVRADVDSAAAMSMEYKQETGVRLSGETHGGGDVKLYAAGAGSQLFKGTMENTRVFDLIRQAAGL
jgi:alkaline phosphatase